MGGIGVAQDKGVTVWFRRRSPPWKLTRDLLGGPRSTHREPLGARRWNVQIDRPGRFLVRTGGEPQVVQAHVAVGEEIGGNLGLRTIPIVLLMLFGECVGGGRRGPPPTGTPGTADAGNVGPRAPPAGWLTDPARRHELRYWDG
jgi:Protein of unknown function (DUF2510)